PPPGECTAPRAPRTYDAARGTRGADVSNPPPRPPRAAARAERSHPRRYHAADRRAAAPDGRRELRDDLRPPAHESAGSPGRAAGVRASTVPPDPCRRVLRGGLSQ